MLRLTTMWSMTTALVVLFLSHSQGALARVGSTRKANRSSSSHTRSTGPSTHWDPKKNPYPSTRRDPNAFDNFKSRKNGTVKVMNPYIWLEKTPDKSGEVQEFISHQRNFTKSYVSAYPQRDEIKAAFDKSFNYVSVGIPWPTTDDFYYYTFNPGSLAQDIYYRVKKGQEEQAMQNAGPKQPFGQLFLDPNIFSSDGTASVTFMEFSPTGKYVAYGISQGGSNDQTIHVRETNSPHLKTAQEGAKRGEDPGRMTDVIEGVNFLSTVSWAKDDHGFFYAKFPKAGDGSGTDINHTVYFHTLGTSASKDIVIMKDPNHPAYRWYAQVTWDGKYLMLDVRQSSSGINQIWIADLTTQEISENMRWQKMVQEFSYEYLYFANRGTLFYLQSNKNAPNRKVVTYDLSKPAQGFQDLIPEDPQAVLGDYYQQVNTDFLVLTYAKVGIDGVYLYDLRTGKLLKRIGQALVIVVTDINALHDGPEFFFRVESYTSPAVIYRYRFDRPAGQEFSVFRTMQVDGLNSDAFVTQQVFYKSKDNTIVPMTLIYLKNQKQDGTAAGLLWGYGGFGVSIQPFFSLAGLLFVARFGGVLAYASIRGGGEYGEKWHLAGSLDKKQNSFDDFQYASKYLVASKYVAPGKVTIWGHSNGGLLVAACVNQAPGLFGAAIADAGVLDMLRFPRFTLGAGWVTEYGDPNQPDAFDYIDRYSPLENINSQASYPAFLLTTASNDDTVVPMHSFKYAAAVQYAIPNNPQPLLLGVTQDEGHIGGTTDQQNEDRVDKLCFIAQSLGLVWNSKGGF